MGAPHAALEPELAARLVHSLALPDEPARHGWVAPPAADSPQAAAFSAAPRTDSFQADSAESLADDSPVAQADYSAARLVVESPQVGAGYSAEPWAVDSSQAGLAEPVQDGRWVAPERRAPGRSLGAG